MEFFQTFTIICTHTDLLPAIILLIKMEAFPRNLAKISLIGFALNGGHDVSSDRGG